MKEEEVDIDRTIELACQGQPVAEDQLAGYIADRLIWANSKEEVVEAIKLLFRIVREMSK